MRALVYADLQATDGHEHLYSNPTQSLQIWRVNQFYQSLLDIYKKFNCTALWDLGDTTDDRTAIPVPAIDALCANLAQFPWNDFNVKLVGNHEQYLRNTQVTVGQLFQPYFRVVSQPWSFMVNDHVQVVCAPYPADEIELATWLEKERAESQGIKSILLGHFQISGCWGPSGQLLAGLTIEKLAWFKLGLLGHIHRPQQIGNCHYVGSPFQQDWGEAGEEKRVGIVDISPEGEIDLQWVDIAGFPEYREVKLHEFNDLCTEGCEDRFRVVLKSPEEAAQFYAHKFSHRAEPQYDFDVSAALAESRAEVASESWTPERVMRHYLDKNPPSDRGIPISSEEMLKFGMEVYSS
jgi:hypothetical protein